jgi:hypothetical protein
VPALAGDRFLEAVTPAEATHVQQFVPVLPNSSMINSFATHSNVTAATMPLGSVVSHSVSGIGNPVAAPITQPLISPGLINSLSPPRIR